jgi:peptidyl-prolyl cis-trans isomerase D
MQVIQTLRDKGAAIIIGVIALSLIGFLLMDAKQGSSGFFKSLSNDIGKVNGESVEKAEYDSRYLTAFDIAQEQAAQSGRAPSSSEVREQVWNQITAEKIFYGEAKKLGIEFTPSEFSALLHSNDPANPFLRDPSMLDSATNKLDPAKVNQAIINIRKAKDKQLETINARMIEPQRIASVSGKYMALINSSMYYPTWLQEKDNAEAKNFANISYAYIPYTEIADSLITVSDKDIETYVQANKAKFKQEAGRMISYVTFSQQPSGLDTTKVRDAVTNLKQAFITDNDTRSFIAKSGSLIPYDSNYVPKSRIQSSVIDSITRMPVGGVYGPYIDNGAYMLAKFLGSRTIADSAKARHILISTKDMQSGQTIMSDSSAKKLADSLLAAINKGADFTALAKQYSTDPGSKDKGGFYDYFPYGQMVPAFNDFVFSKAAGTRAVIKTDFGYHVIEAMGTKGSSAAYKIAFIAKEIVATEATINDANLSATKLSGIAGGKDFDAYVAKNGLQKITWPQVIKENDYRIGQFQDAGQVVEWVFNAKKGDVSTPFNMGTMFIVATVDKIAEEGVQNAAAARPMAEAAVRNKKKAEMIIKKLGANPTPETAAAAYNKQVQSAGTDSSIVMGGQMIPNVGVEPRVIGASFNKDNQTKASAPIAGTTGVFVIKVNGISSKPADTPESSIAIVKQRAEALRRQAGGWFEGLRLKSTIKDKRRNNNN